MIADRILVAFAGLCGAAGVAFSAVAAHAGGGNVGTAASFLLMHAPAFLALGLAARGQFMRLAGLALLLGVLVFCGDLLMRDYAGARLFPMAAPAGGVLIIVGWLAIAVCALSPRPTSD
ncbi:DUF423 domain-containing protein [Rhizobiaceae sp. 2RAB30]